MDRAVLFVYHASVSHGEKQSILGCRYINSDRNGCDDDCKCIGRVDVASVVELGETLKAKMEAANEIIIKDGNGTYLTAKNEGRPVRHSGQLATFKGTHL